MKDLLTYLTTCLYLFFLSFIFFLPLHLQICDDVASQVLGKSVFVHWPHLEEARIIAVSDGDTK